MALGPHEMSLVGVELKEKVIMCVSVYTLTRLSVYVQATPLSMSTQIRRF